MKVVAVIQARMGSTRLPGKVMMNLGGRPVLNWCWRACYQAPGVDEVWIATSTLPADDVIEDWCKKNSINIFRGSESDVLDRFYGCAKKAEADIILRLTGDCPFLDPQVIGGVVHLMTRTPGCQYASNISPRTYPDGLDVQGMTRWALYSAWSEATRPLDRDGVCTFIERNRSWLPAETLINPIPGMQDERWVLDTEADLNFCECIAECWPWENRTPSMLDIVGILDKYPTFRGINSSGIMNERYFAALAEEPIYERTYQRSFEQFRRATQVIPLAAQTFSKSSLQYAQPSPLFLSHGQGALAWDIDGNEYVDLVSALLPTVLGVRDPDVDAAIRRQLCSGISFTLATELEAELAETLCRLIPCAEAVRFGKSGTDVTTAAVRLARAFTGRDLIISSGYHGWSDPFIAHTRGRGVPADVARLTIPADASTVLQEVQTRLAGEKFACVILEPESAHGLAEIRNICDRTGTVLIYDEVITGFRFDLGGAQKLWGVTPDLACFGKAMANGMPLSAIVGRRDIMKLMEPPDNIFYSGTFFGEALSLAAGIATIKKLERENIIATLWETGEALHRDVDILFAKHRISHLDMNITGAAPYKRLTFKDDKIAALFRREMVKTGTLITASHNLCAAHGPNEIKRILKSYDHALGFVRAAIDEGSVERRLAGASVGPMVRVDGTPKTLFRNITTGDQELR